MLHGVSAICAGARVPASSEVDEPKECCGPGGRTYASAENDRHDLLEYVLNRFTMSGIVQVGPRSLPADEASRRWNEDPEVSCRATSAKSLC
jgi:hypothetical protein